jgi:glycosyltransferase involved in cell wall biosynthesis
LVTDYALSDRVIFTGLLTEGDVHAAYAAADVFVLPSRFDTFPMAIVEALASGTPVLVTDACQSSGLITKQAGLVTPVNAMAIADGLRQLLFDRNMRDTYVHGARSLAKAEFSIHKTVDLIESVYRQVLDANSRNNYNVSPSAM